MKRWPSVPFQQLRAETPVRALVAMAKATLLAARGQQLQSLIKGQVEELIRVILGITQEPVGARRLPNQLGGHRFFTDVHRADTPGLGHGSRSPDGIQLVTFRQATSTPSPFGVWIL